MKEFNKERAFDDIIKILLKANDVSPSKQFKIYGEVMEYLDGIANTQFQNGYMSALEIGKEINQN